MSKSKEFCKGCRANIYNQPGNSITGECWLLDGAKIVERTFVGIWQTPPYEWRPVKTYHCNRPDGLVGLKETDYRFQHNWKECD